MTKFTLNAIAASLLIATHATTSIANAEDFVGTGARYAAQGGTMVANANDAFALLVNPANLTVQDADADHFEFAINAQHYSRMGEQITASDQSEHNDIQSETDLQYIGGFKVSNDWLLGFYATSPSTPLYAQFGNAPLPTELSVTQYGVAYAKGGSIFGNTDNARWALGGTLDLVSANVEGGRNINPDYAYTLAGALYFNKAIAFQTQAVDLQSQFGVSYTSEVESELEQVSKITIRPSVKRVGASVSLSHLNENLSWRLSLAAEIYQSDAKYAVPTSINDFVDGIPVYIDHNGNVDEQRYGGEFTIIQPFGVDGDVAFRAGLKVRENDLHFGSSGVGFSSGSWSYDLAVSESTLINDELNYDLSITVSF